MNPIKANGKDDQSANEGKCPGMVFLRALTTNSNNSSLRIWKKKSINVSF